MLYWNTHEAGNSGGFLKKYLVLEEKDWDPIKRQLDGVYTLKGNSFYRQIIEDLKRHKSTKFTKSQNIDKDVRCPF